MSQAARLTSVHPDAEVRSLEDQITELAAHISAATYRLLELIREFDERGGWAGPGLKSCAHWLNWKCGINLGAAREKVRVAHAIKDLPKISAAFLAGTISYAKVRAMTRVARPENEDYLLMIARHGTASHVERLVRLYRGVKRSEALAEDNRKHELRELSWYQDEDGCWVFRAKLPADSGARVIQALQSAMEEEFEERKNVSAETPEEEKDRWDLDPVANRRADALVRVAEGYLAGSAGSNGGDRCTLNLHADLNTLRADGAGAEAELEESGCISAETSRRLSCDAGVVRWREDESGEPLNVGRKTRSIPPAIRRVLQRRDRGCRFPGCTATRFVDAHHIQHWADGGETNLNNLVLLCRHHHRLVHEGGFGVGMTETGARFTQPNGKALPPVPETRFRGNVFALMSRNQRAGLGITPETPIPYWYGEPMDDSLAVEGLLVLT